LAINAAYDNEFVGDGVCFLASGAGLGVLGYMFMRR
jgi:hypothetical protein